MDKIAEGERIISARYAEVFYFKELKLIFEVWNDKSEFTSWDQRKAYHLDKMTEFGKYDFNVCITDTREYRNLPDPDDIVWFNQHIFHHQLSRERLDILVNILPAEALRAMALEMAEVGMKLPFEMKHASSIEEALNLLGFSNTSLNFNRTSSKASFRKKIL